MATNNQSILDHYLFPRGLDFPPLIDIGAANGAIVDVHRFEDLSLVMNLARRVKVEVKEEHEVDNKGFRPRQP